MTLTQNLKFAAKRLPRLERHRRVAEMLDRFQLTPFAQSRPAGLGPAHRLRAAVARALITEPKLLLLDNRDWDESLLREIRVLTAAPILLVTRDLDLCCASASTLIILENGRILQRGAPHEVIDAPESVEAARVLGIPNLFQGTISALDPTRNTSRIDCENFTVTAAYIPGHFRGDQIWIAIDPHDVRVHGEAAPDNIPAQLIRASEHTQTVRLEFAGPIYADLSREDYRQQRDNKVWRIEFPPEAIKIL